MGANRNIPDREQVVFRVIVEEGTNPAGCHQRQGGINNNWEFYVSVFILG